MTTRKLNAVSKLCKTSQYPQTFASRLADIPDDLKVSLTAKQIAMMIDTAMQASYNAGHDACHVEMA